MYKVFFKQLTAVSICFIFQPVKVGNTLDQIRSSPRKIKMTDSESNGASSRPKTSATTTSSPRKKDSMAKSHTGNAAGKVNATGTSGTGTVNAKKRLVVPPQAARPQTSPEVVMAKNHVAANRTQSRMRTLNSKRKAGNVTQIKSNCFTESSQQISDEKPKDVQEDHKDCSAAEVLVVSGSRAGFSNGALPEEARTVSSLGQGGELESISRLSYTDKQLKEPSPPSRNNRYGNGIKTRLAKLFNKGNACMEEPKVVEPDRSQGIDHISHSSQSVSGNLRPGRY